MTTEKSSLNICRVLSSDKDGFTHTHTASLFQADLTTVEGSQSDNHFVSQPDRFTRQVSRPGGAPFTYDADKENSREFCYPAESRFFYATEDSEQRTETECTEQSIIIPPNIHHRVSPERQQQANLLAFSPRATIYLNQHDMTEERRDAREDSCQADQQKAQTFEQILSNPNKSSMLDLQLSLQKQEQLGEISKSQLVLDIDRISVDNNDDGQNQTLAASERNFLDLLQPHHTSTTDSKSLASEQQTNENATHGLSSYKNLTSAIVPQRRVTLKQTDYVDKARKGMPPLYSTTLSTTKSQRSSRSVRQPHFSPINNRRTEEEKLAAKQKTLDRKKALRVKRELASQAQQVYTLLVDEQTLLCVYQLYYQECMQAQARNHTSKSLLESSVVCLTREVATDCLKNCEKETLEASTIAVDLVESLIQTSVVKVFEKQLVEKSVAQHQSDETQQKESLADSVCDKLLSALLTEHLAEQLQSSKKQLPSTTPRQVEQKAEEPSKVVELSSQEQQHRQARQSPRDLMADQMGQFASQIVEDKLVDQMISNAVQEHLLVECAFEAILKSLLREPSTPTEDRQEQPDRAANEEAEPSYSTTQEVEASSKTQAAQAASRPASKSAFLRLPRSSSNKEECEDDKDRVVTAALTSGSGGDKTEDSAPHRNSISQAKNGIISGGNGGVKEKANSICVFKKYDLSKQLDQKHSQTSSKQKVISPQSKSSSNSKQHQQKLHCFKAITLQQPFKVVDTTVMSEFYQTTQSDRQQQQAAKESSLQLNSTHSIEDQQQRTSVRQQSMSSKSFRQQSTGIGKGVAAATLTKSSQQQNQRKLLFKSIPIQGGISRSPQAASRPMLSTAVAKSSCAEESDDVADTPLSQSIKLQRPSTSTLIHPSTQLKIKKLSSLDTTDKRVRLSIVTKQSSTDQLSRRSTGSRKITEGAQNNPNNTSNNTTKRGLQHGGATVSNNLNLVSSTPQDRNSAKKSSLQPQKKKEKTPEKEQKLAATSTNFSQMSKDRLKSRQQDLNPVRLQNKQQPTQHQGSTNHGGSPSMAASKFTKSHKMLFSTSTKVLPNTKNLHQVVPAASAAATATATAELQVQAKILKMVKHTPPLPSQNLGTPLSKKNPDCRKSATSIMSNRSIKSPVAVARSFKDSAVALCSSATSLHKSVESAKNFTISKTAAVNSKLRKSKTFFSKLNSPNLHNNITPVVLSKQQTKQVSCFQESKKSLISTSGARLSFKKSGSGFGPGSGSGTIGSNGVYFNTNINTTSGKSVPKNTPRDMLISAGRVSKFDDQTAGLVVGHVYDAMVLKQVRQVAGKYVQSVIFDHLYRKTMKKVMRMMLFQVIQESVDLIYFLEEDTIQAANSILDAVIFKETRLVALECVQLASFQQHSRQQVSNSSCFRSHDDDDSLQVVQDDEEGQDKQSNIQRSIRNSAYQSPRMGRKSSFQSDFKKQVRSPPGTSEKQGSGGGYSFLKHFTEQKSLQQSKLQKSSSGQQISKRGDNLESFFESESPAQADLINKINSQALLVQDPRSAQKPHNSVCKHINAFSVDPEVDGDHHQQMQPDHSQDQPQEQDQPIPTSSCISQADECLDSPKKRVLRRCISPRRENFAWHDEPSNDHHLKRLQDAFFSTPQIQMPEQFQDFTVLSEKSQSSAGGEEIGNEHPNVFTSQEGSPLKMNRQPNKEIRTTVVVNESVPHSPRQMMQIVAVSTPANAVAVATDPAEEKMSLKNMLQQSRK